MPLRSPLAEFERAVAQQEQNKKDYEPMFTRPANMRLEMTKVIEKIKDNKELTDVVLTTLKHGVGGIELVARYGGILEVVDEKSLTEFVNYMPKRKIEHMKEGLSQRDDKLPRLEKVIDACL